MVITRTENSLQPTLVLKQAPQRHAIAPIAHVKRKVSYNSQDETRAEFIGWVSGDPSNQAKFCNAGFTWTASGSFATCCSLGASCAQFVACESTSVLLDSGGSKLTCLDGGACAVTTVFENPSSATPQSLIDCWSGQVTDSILYRHIQGAETTTQTATSNLSVKPPDQTSMVNSVAGARKGSNKGVIAGVVVAAIVGLALVGIAVFCLRKRKAARAIAGNTEITEGYNNFEEEKQVVAGAHEWRTEADSTQVSAPIYEMSALPARRQLHEIQGS
ncbi:hypothetical protein OPT61_g2683 [Boeremia exigua]|uniref:Uncharacterized protein n=1 Tax=Boeremia exigua TaxID=749465 RepID=A0ACC2IKQ7_9PLEO|nr:hypothetical protein OPT61_g2683 [Boeremia exigua]